MKKIFILIFSLSQIFQTKAQNKIDTSYWFVENEGQLSLNRPMSDSGDYYYQWCRISVQNKKGWGVYCEIAQDTAIFSLGLGVVKAVTNYPYFEIYAGPEIDMYRYDRGIRFALNLGTYFATKPDHIRVQGKIELMFTYWRSNADSWYSSYALVSPFKWLSVGVFSQKNVVEPGPIVRINLPLMRPWVAMNSSYVTVGINIVGGWETQKKRK